MNSNLSFSPLEETISFYTRNDYAIINHFLVGNMDNIWRYALLAYNDNKGIVEEYERGERIIASDYDVKWLSCLKKRTIDSLDDAAKESIIQYAKNDISNILNAMYPAKESLHLFRTAWFDKERASGNSYPYSREYKAIELKVGGIIEINTISSCSRTPYREDEDDESEFCRYEIHVPRGMPILELDEFITHNEDGEILLPPMKCKVVNIRNGEFKGCRNIIELLVMIN